MICDLVSAILRCECWLVDEFNFSMKKMTPRPNLFAYETPLGKALAPDVLVDPDPRGKMFCCVDEFITIDYMSEAWKRLACAVVLAIDVVSMPVNKSESIS